MSSPPLKLKKVEAERRTNDKSHKPMIWVKSHYHNFATSLRTYTEEEAQGLVDAMAKIGIKAK